MQCQKCRCNWNIRNSQLHSMAFYYQTRKCIHVLMKNVSQNPHDEYMCTCILV